MQFVVVQGCPVPKKMAPFLTELLRETGAHLNSCYRGDEARSLLHHLGKHTQSELYHGFVTHQPGYYPANPPGHSTHELFNDGLAYPGPSGKKLQWWQVGIDVNDSDVARVIAAARKRGWTVAQTYPGSKAEFHHINFRRPPLRQRIKAAARARKIQTLSAKGAAFIGRYEGFRAQPYDDAAGYATVGFGHLIGKRHVTAADRQKWGTLSRAQGLKLLRRDAEAAASSVRDHVKVPLTQKQFDALVSFVFNVGGGNFASSTLLKKINAGDLRAASAEFQRWDKAGGRTLAGLTTRRRAEARLFSGGPYS